MVVDDEKRVRDAFIDAFDEYEIIPVADGERALHILKQPNDIDIVVLDVMLVGLTGIEVLHEIKTMNPCQVVIICTGCNSKGVVIEALRAQADEYIEKPFDIELTKEIFEKLLRKNKNFSEEAVNERKGKVQQAQRFIEINYNKPLHLQDIARELFLSPKYLSRVLKEKTGKSFNEHKIEFRMQKAKQLLKQTNFTICEIAYKVGYQNPESFMKAFKKFTHMEPSRYRESTK